MTITTNTKADAAIMEAAEKHDKTADEATLTQVLIESLLAPLPEERAALVIEGIELYVSQRIHMDRQMMVIELIKLDPERAERILKD